MVIPDAIEPYLGWKALKLSESGLLYSPQRGTAWPAGQRLEATCTKGGNRILNFRALGPDDPNPDNVFGIWYCEPGQLILSTIPGFGTYNFAALPEGCNRWVAVSRLQKQEILDERCSCGIYVVDDPKGCIGYFRPRSTVLVQVALWGKVRIGDRGARGQYAYPQIIYADKGAKSSAERAAVLYNTELVVLQTILRNGKMVTLPLKENE